MLKKDETKLEIFGFGDDDTDKFYALVNLKKSPDGIDLETLSNADPRRFDEVLNSMGCILLLRGDEIEELIHRDDISEGNLHTGIYKLAVKEEIIQ